MTILNLVLSALLLICVFIASWIGILNWRRYKAQQLVAEDLDIVLQATLELARLNKDAVNQWEALKNKETQNLTIEDLYNRGLSADDDITSPQILSTILTVIVHKYGNLNLALKDFMSVPDEEYISVYVDTNSKELILSIKHDLATDGPIAMAPFSNPGDDTFH